MKMFKGNEKRMIEVIQLLYGAIIRFVIFNEQVQNFSFKNARSKLDKYKEIHDKQWSVFKHPLFSYCLYKSSLFL